jgi:hypothetical protein
LILSNAKTTNPLTGLYFQNKGVYNIKNVANSYVLGLELEGKHSYLLDLLTNFEKLKHPSNRSANYYCGNNCDYVYMLPDCGMPRLVYKCPWCKADIGGTGHKLFERKGHINMNDE